MSTTVWEGIVQGAERNEAVSVRVEGHVKKVYNDPWEE